MCLHANTRSVGETVTVRGHLLRDAEPRSRGYPSPMSEAEGTYTPAQAAKILHLSEGRIIQLITDGDLAGAMDEGGRWRIPRRAVHVRLANRLADKPPRAPQAAPMPREADFYTPGEAARLLGLTE